jgi:hypothetical protein
MIDLYSLPLGQSRFETYLSLLKGGTKGDLILPIGGYNPMAKGHVLDKLNEAKKLDVESIMMYVCESIDSNRDYKVAFTLADDVGGGWTNKYTTDFSSKFDLHALYTRRFCTPYFWSSEILTKELIIHRTKQQCYRSIHQEEKGRLKTLEDHVVQELFVADKCESNSVPYLLEFINSKTYLVSKESEEYNLIFNFFYGDEASTALGYKTYGFNGING